MRKNFLNWGIFILVVVSVATFLMIQIDNYSNNQINESIMASVNSINLSSNTPQFSDYPVDEVFKGTPKDESNFAGHYTISLLGCGTMCRVIDINDVENGKLYHSNFSVSLDIDFRKDSNLIIINSPESIKEYLNPDFTADWLYTEYYLWENDQFIPLNKHGKRLKYINPPYESKSYEQYYKALERYKKDGDQYGIETMEWSINNINKVYGDILELKEYDGEYSCGGATLEAELENENYKFVRCFKGPTFVYNKSTNKHILIFNPVVEINKYAGIHPFTWDDRYLDIFYGIFDMQTGKILETSN